MDRTLVVLFVALALLPVPARFAVPAASAADAPNVDASARFEDGSLVVDVAASGASRVHVIVTHEDPTLGTLVDRVLPVDLDVAATIHVDLREIRVGLGSSVVVIDASVDLPTLGPTGILNGSAIAALPSLGRVAVPPLPVLPEGRPHVVGAYEAGVSAAESLVVTTDGIVVVLGRDGQRIVASASADGGRTFGGAVVVAEFDEEVEWSAAQGARGTVEILHRAVRPPATRGAWEWTTLVGAPASVVPHGKLPLPWASRLGVDVEIAPLPDGALLLVAPAEDGDGLDALRAGPEGSVERVARVGLACCANDFAVAAHPAGGVAVVGWNAPSMDARARVLVARSDDGGTSWRVEDVSAAVPGISALDVRNPVLDEDGTLHLAVGGEPAPGGPREAYYIRLPRAGPATSLVLSEPVEEAIGEEHSTVFPGVVESDRHVWLLWREEWTSTAEDPGGPRAWGRQFATESVDGGATFGPRYSMREFHGHRLSRALGERRAADALPDGRPVVLADVASKRTVVPLFDPAPDRGASVGATQPFDPVTFDYADGDNPATVFFDEVGRGRGTFRARDDGGGARYRLDFRGLPAGAIEAPGVETSFALAPSESREVSFDLLWTPLPGSDPAPAEIAVGVLDDGFRSSSSLSFTLVPAGQRPSEASLAAEPGAPPPRPSGGGIEPVSLPPAVAAGAAAGALVAGLAVAALATEAGRYALGLLLAPFYSRLAPSGVLGHDVRRSVHEHVASNPGIRFERLRRELGLANGVLAYHLHVLVRTGHVSARSEWTHRAFYASGAAPRAAPAATADAAILAALAGGDGSPAAVGRRLGITRQLARYHLVRLARGGSVVREARGRFRAR